MSNDKVEATFHGPNEERVERYRQAWFRDCEGETTAIPGLLRVIAVADAEQTELRATLDRVRLYATEVMHHMAASPILDILNGDDDLDAFPGTVPADPNELDTRQ